MKKFRFFAIVLSALFLLSAPAVAETVMLTEEKVIDLFLESNLDVQLAEADRKISETDIQRAQSAFDTSLNSRVDYLINKKDQAIPLFGTDNRTLNFDVEASKTFSTGTRTEAFWRNHRESTNSPFAVLNPFYEPTLGLSVSQPFLRNFAGRIDRGNVTVARRRFEAVDVQTRRRILEALRPVALTYWKWIRDLNNLEITQRSLQEAFRLEEATRLKLSFALNDFTDVVASQANRVRMESDVLSAQLEGEVSRLKLRELLNLEPDTQMLAKEKIPPLQKAPPIEDALSFAFAHRADYQSALKELEARKMEVKVAEDKKWPELDLIATLEMNGVDRSYGQSLSEAFTADHPSFLAGAQFNWVIENRLAKSEAKRLDLERFKSVLELKQLQNRIVREVEAAWREVKNQEKQVGKRRRIEELERQKWALELEKYKTARSSSDLVIRYQEDYLTAQRESLNALYFYRQAWLDLLLAQEKLLPERPERKEAP